MRLIYTRDGFTKNEKAEWRIIIFQNIIDGLRMIVDAMEEFEIGFEFENTTVRPLDLLPRRYASPHPPLTDPRSTFLSLWRRKTSILSSPYRSSISEPSKTCGQMGESKRQLRGVTNMRFKIIWASTSPPSFVSPQMLISSQASS